MYLIEINKAVDATHQNKRGFTAYLLAAQGGWLTILKYLDKMGFAN